MSHYHKTLRNTARIARAIGNVAVCRTFMRAILLANTARICSIIARYRKYQPPTDRVEIAGLAGLSPR
jgi:hypothetical protein